MDGEKSGRVVIVTGGSAGIGYAVARKFLAAGDRVAILSTNEERGRRAEAVLAELGEAVWVRCHVNDYDECAEAVAEVERRLGPVDVLVNNAGIVSKRVGFLDVDLDDVRRTLDVDVMGTINMARAVVEGMVSRGSGTIVNVGSICGRMANTESVGYHAAKGAVEMVTKSLARELAGSGVRVVCVAPGWVRTEMIDDTVAEVGASLHMKGRIIEPAEIAGVVWLLTLPEAAAVNGSTVMADDGYASFKGIDGGLQTAEVRRHARPVARAAAGAAVRATGREAPSW